MLEVSVQRAKERNALIKQLAVLPIGTHTITVAEVAFVDIYLYDFCDQRVIIRDTRGRLIELNEKLLKFSRHDVREGMSFEIEVESTNLKADPVITSAKKV